MTTPAGRVRPLVRRNRWDRFWAPTRLGWWMAVLFMIGSALFAIGGAQATWPNTTWIAPKLVGWIFFVGSLFFTSAAYLQLFEALNNDLTHPRPAGTRFWRYWGWNPRNLGFQAAFVQLIGTVLFNFNTGDALFVTRGQTAEDLLIWTPDLIGSLCFLAASQFALMEFSHHWWSFAPRSLSWWIVIANYAGSVIFMISAIASFVTPGDQMAAPWLANFGTCAGGVCFFIGSYLLIPELFERPPENGQ